MKMIASDILGGEMVSRRGILSSERIQTTLAVVAEEGEKGGEEGKDVKYYTLLHLLMTSEI